MMRPTLLVLLVWQVVATAQTRFDDRLEFQIDFPERSSEISEGIKAQIDSIYDLMPVEREVRVHLISKQEVKALKPVHVHGLTSKRAEMCGEYLLYRGLGRGEFWTHTEPFEPRKPNKSMSNRAYRNFTDQRGTHSLVLLKVGANHRPVTHMIDSDDGETPCSVGSVDIGYKSKVWGDKGTILQFPANSLVLKNTGRPPSCEKAQVCVKEYYELWEMVAANLVTVSGDRMLVSAGMIHVSASCEEGELELAPGKRVYVYMPTEQPLNKKMKVFEGRHGDVVDWKESAVGEVKLIEASDVIDEFSDEYISEGGESDVEGFYPETDGYLMSVAKLGWINCDAFYDVKKPTQMIVEIDSSRAIAVRMVFHDMKSVLPAYYYAPGQKVKFDGIPPGREVTVIAYAVSKDKKKAMIGIREVTTGEDMRLNLRNLNTTTVPEMKAKLSKSLDL